VTDFVLLTGFLGSGKTTLLGDLLRAPEGADTAVIVNEAGAIDIDGAVIAETSGNVPMALLANGCVCCSIANDLLYTVEALIASRPAPFRRIVLETSGLAMPGPILRALGELGPLGMRAGVVTTCDATAPPFGEAEFDVAAAQVAGAGTLVLTKLDRAAPDAAEALAARLGAINPLAGCVVEADPGRRAVAAFTAPARTGPTKGEAAGHPRIAVMTARLGRVGFDALMEWLENLAGLAGGRLLRVKGVVRLADVAPKLLIQAVGTVFSPPRAFEAPAETGLIIIARDMGAAEIAAMQPGFPVRFEAGAAGPWRQTPVQRLASGSSWNVIGSG